MLRPTSTVRKGGPALEALLCVLLLSTPLPAGAEVAVYQAVAPLAGTAATDRATAFGDALRSAAVRASGQRDAGSNPVIVAAAADPSRYVQQYSMTADHMIKVGFDARAMDQLLQQAGLPLWPLERPITLVLLVVPSVAGGERAVVEGERVAERAEIERAAQARGLPIAWPRQAVDAARVRAAVAGSDPGAGVPSGAGGQGVLAGVGTGSQVTWRFSQADQSARADGSLQDGIRLAADSLAARYAPASTKGTSSVTVRVAGMQDVKAYAGLLEYLKSLSLVRAIAVEELADGVLTLKLAVRGDLELLRRIVALDSRLQTPAPPGPDAGAPVDFNYSP
jgi:hypothetical protein